MTQPKGSFGVVIQDPEMVAYADWFCKAHGDMSYAAFIRMCEVEFIAHHPQMTIEREKLVKAVDLYKQFGYMNPQFLTRRRVADSYKEAVAIIEELVASGQIAASEVSEMIDMASVTP